MKKLTFISLFIFWAIIVSVLTAGLITGNKNAGVLVQPANQNINAVTSTAGGASGVNQNTPAVTLTAQEVAKHNNASDCWIIISNKVYNLTSFISIHSGGAAAILQGCGKDGTVAFETKDSSPARSHQSGDINILQSYYIGDLNQNVSQQNIQNAAQNSASRTNSLFPGRDDD